jgi:hypothetical protein
MIAPSLRRSARSAPERPAALRELVEVDVVGERLATCVHIEDRPAAIGGGQVDQHMA